MKLSAIVVVLMSATVAAFLAVPTPAAPAANVLEATTFKVDPVHSTLHFKIRHMGVSNFYGRFNEFGGNYTFDPDNLSAATFDFAVKVSSIDTGNTSRDKHLRSADFFTTAEYDTITFKSTKVESAKTEGIYDVTGDLTFHGETKSITVPLQWFGVKDGGERMGIISGFETIFTIKRSDFGMDYGVDNGALGDDVTLTAAFEGKKADAASRK